MVTKLVEGNENADEDVSAVKGNKQFGPSATKKSFIRSNKEFPALKLKSNNQKNDQFNKNSNEKKKLQVYTEKITKSSERSNIPLKRGESAIGQTQHSQTKKQDIRVERTQRHKEEEQEWEPQGFHLDFNAFDGTAQESSYHDQKELLEDDDVKFESFPVVERQFTIKSTIDIEDDQEQLEIEHDTSTVEYGPPKEQEIPYQPDESCIVDASNFTPYADIDAYEYIRLSKNNDSFTLYQDPDALEQDMNHPINDETLEFEYDSEGVDQGSDLSNDLDFSSIPYNDYVFDVDHFIQCN
ncbi:hypothetical protein [Parasitella parasitica]|uniref:Uncharacterized protein n=1 Tax=Parasitella parasitica TaxID=35722 RepID=A0A0B7NI45_9FUNG|nr:hypothetical protein [Parasitella parasitica]